MTSAASVDALSIFEVEGEGVLRVAADDVEQVVVLVVRVQVPERARNAEVGRRAYTQQRPQGLRRREPAVYILRRGFPSLRRYVVRQQLLHMFQPSRDQLLLDLDPDMQLQARVNTAGSTEFEQLAGHNMLTATTGSMLRLGTVSVRSGVCASTCGSADSSSDGYR